MGDISQHENNFFANIYLNKGYKTAAALANLVNGDLVLDYGCGTKRLQKFLPAGCNYVGYDLDKKYSEIKNIKGLNPNVVFCLSVLLLLSKEQLNDFSDLIAGKKPRLLVVSVPCEYYTNRFFRFVFAKDFANEVFHQSHWKDVGKALLKNFELVEVKRIWLMQWITAWKPRE